MYSEYEAGDIMKAAVVIDSICRRVLRFTLRS